VQHDICSYRQSPATTVPDSVVWLSLPNSKDHKKQLLAVVHTDLEDNTRRQSNTVLSGLVPKPGVMDVDLFLDACERNLTLKPYVVRIKCPRLGRPQSGKIQPLFICLNNAEIANDCWWRPSGFVDLITKRFGETLLQSRSDTG
jgi:hypothetical protein